ncbi:RHS repeat-associated core domain-containing protein [Thalassotalea sp. PLHSN55]|uniref:RHS repeat-associated core domain-containing protein n=1 Tax=Thalassotalea sp. PLHSN55 TaxID=3435888 RepID=UPI003F880276
MKKLPVFILFFCLVNACIFDSLAVSQSSITGSINSLSGPRYTMFNEEKEGETERIITRGSKLNLKPGKQVWAGDDEVRAILQQLSRYLDDSYPGQSMVDEGGPASTEEKCGNPTNMRTGNKIEEYIDFKGTEEFPLTIARVYSHYSDQESSLGNKWLTSFGSYLRFKSASCEFPDSRGVYDPQCFSNNFEPGQSDILAYRPGGEKVLLKRTSGYQFSSGQAYTATYDATTESFSLLFKGGNTERYNIQGQVTKITSVEGISHNYSYESGELSTITHSNGRTLTFSKNNNVLTITNSADESYLYHISNNLLSKVIMPNGDYFEYKYDDTRHPYALTRTLINGKNYGHFSYDGLGHSISNGHGVDKNNLEDHFQFEFNYFGDANHDGKIDDGVYNGAGEAIDDYGYRSYFYKPNYTVKITNPLGKVTKYHYVKSQGIQKRQLVKVVGEASAYCGSTTREIDYDENGHLEAKYDFEGNKTEYHYSENGVLEWLQRPGSERTYVDYAEHHPGRIEEYRIGTAGTKLKRHYKYDYLTSRISEVTFTDMFGTDGTDPVERKVTYNYKLHANGMLSEMTIDGSREVNDLTFFEFDNLGNTTLINYANYYQVQYTKFDSVGRVLEEISPSGQAITYSYYPGGRLHTSTINNQTTTFEYTPLGQLKKVIDSNGNVSGNVYSDTYKLLYSYNGENEFKTVNTRDALGNLESLSFKANQEASPEFVALVKYDELGRIRLQEGQNGQAVSYQYNANGSIQYECLTSSNCDETVENKVSYTYHPNGKVHTITEPDTSVTTFEYNTMGFIESITDAIGRTTSYTYNNFGEVIQLDSPDTGKTTFKYDVAGNLIYKKGAEGTARYKYDALNRLTIKVAGLEMQSWQYDEGDFGAGKLTGAVQYNNCSSYEYNAIGQLAEQNDYAIDRLFNVSYQYHDNGLLKSIVYPSGNVVSYEYDNANRPSSVQVNNENLVSNIDYKPFGPPTSWLYGNNLTQNNQYDTDYRIDTINTTGILSLDLDYYDDNNTVEFLTNNYHSELSQQYIYDEQFRLTHALVDDDRYSYEYRYDDIGNRITVSPGGIPLTQRSYSFNALKQKVSVIIDGEQVGKYAYNNFGQRIYKEDVIGDTRKRFIYGPGSVLFTEQEETSNNYRDYIYMAGQVIGFIDNGQVYYVHNDQVGRPVSITDSNGNEQWRTGNFAFFSEPLLDNIGGFNIGYPGQYFDSESGLWYNINRYYDPETGRYTQSDPIGLLGGMNTYTYVSGNPITKIDPLGLIEASCQPESTGGCGYEDGQKVCSYTCTSGGVTKSGIKGSSSSTSGGDICYGYAYNTTMAGGHMVTVSGAMSPFIIETEGFKGLIDGYIFYDPGFQKNINEAFKDQINDKP